MDSDELNAIRESCDTETTEYPHFHSSMPTAVGVALDMVGAYFDDTKKIKVLDLGCGSGFVLSVFSKAGYSVYGVDESKEMVDLSLKNAPGAHVIVADYLDKGFEKVTFDDGTTPGDIDVFYCFFYKDAEHPLRVFESLSYAKKGSVVISPMKEFDDEFLATYGFRNMKKGNFSFIVKD